MNLINVVAVRVSEAACIAVDESDVLSPGEFAKAERFRKREDRWRFMIGRASLRALIGERLSVEPDSLEFGANAHGKLHLLSNPEASLWFNTSHSGEWVVHALGADGPVGIDIETIRSSMRSLDDFLAVFSKPEIDRLRRVPPASRPAEVAQAWARKEAYVKAIGEGLSRSMRDICIETAHGGQPVVVFDRNPPTLYPQWMLQDLNVAGGHAACVAWSGGPATVELREWEMALDAGTLSVGAAIPAI